MFSVFLRSNSQYVYSSLVSAYCYTKMLYRLRKSSEVVGSRRIR